MPSVPNWIAKAVIYTPGYASEGTVMPIRGWRATQTQVIVSVVGPRGPVERRFKLDGLTEIGGSDRYRRARLIDPDSPEAITARRAQAIQRARAHILTAIDKQRLQDSSDDAEAMIKKMFALRVAVDEAIAQVGEVL